MSPPLPRRFLKLPFSPRLWSDAARLRSARVVLSLWLLSALLWLALGLQAALTIGGWLRQVADEWSAHPAVIVEDGKIRIDGGGLIRVERDAFLVLVDPEENIPLVEVVAPEYVVVRETTILAKRAGQELQVVTLESLAPLLGDAPLTLDGPRLDRWLDDSGVALMFAVILAATLLLPPLDVVSCVLSAIIGGAAAQVVEGARRGVSFLVAFRVALAVTSTTLVLGLTLALVGLRIGGLAERLLWLLWVTVLTSWRLKNDYGAPEA